MSAGANILGTNPGNKYPTDAARLNYTFHPTSAALGDTVRIRGADSSVVVFVDPWNGVAYAGQQ